MRARRQTPMHALFGSSNRTAHAELSRAELSRVVSERRHSRGRRAGTWVALTFCALIGAVISCASLRAPLHASLHAGPYRGVELWGFTAPWDNRSAASVSAHRDALNVIVSGWIALDSASFRPVVLFPDTLSAHPDSNPRYMTLVTSYHGTRFRPETIRGLAADATALGLTAGEASRLAERAKYRGIVLDFEGMTGDDLSTLLTVVKAFADSARAHNVGPVGMAIPATDTTAYPTPQLLQSLDFLVVMLYDQHWLTSPPGPIAAPDWARRQLGMRVGEAGAGKLVAAYPVYGYEWRSDSATAVLSYNDAQRIASAANAPLTREPSSMTLHSDTDRWHIWVSDAALLDTLIRDGRTLGVTKFALWRLGLEDPTVWTHVVAGH